MQYLLQYFKNDELSHGIIKVAVIKFYDHHNTISYLWKQAKTSKINDDKIYNVNLQKG